MAKKTDTTLAVLTLTDQDRAALVGKSAAGYTEEQVIRYLVPVRQKMINASKAMLISLEEIGAGLATIKAECRFGDWGKTLEWLGIGETWAREAIGWAAACEKYPIFREAVASGRLQLSAAQEIGSRAALPAPVVDAIMQDVSDDSGMFVTRDDVRSIFADHAQRAASDTPADAAPAPRRRRGDDLGFAPPTDERLIRRRLDWLKEEGTRAAARLDRAGVQTVVLDRSSAMRAFWARLQKPQPNDPLELDHVRELVREAWVYIYGGTLIGAVVPYTPPQTPEAAEALHADEHAIYTAEQNPDLAELDKTPERFADGESDDPHDFSYVGVCGGCGVDRPVNYLGACVECWAAAEAAAVAADGPILADPVVANFVGYQYDSPEAAGEGVPE